MIYPYVARSGDGMVAQHLPAKQWLGPVRVALMPLAACGEAETLFRLFPAPDGVPKAPVGAGAAGANLLLEHFRAGGVNYA